MKNKVHLKNFREKLRVFDVIFIVANNIFCFAGKPCFSLKSDKDSYIYQVEVVISVNKVTERTFFNYLCRKILRPQRTRASSLQLSIEVIYR